MSWPWPWGPFRVDWPQLPVGEHAQDAAYNRPYQGFPPLDVGHRRNAPAERPFVEHNPIYGDGWWRGNHKLKNFKPKKYLTRPHDGKRPGAWGRFKDALSGEGADVFVTISGDKRTLMRDRPQRWQWTGVRLTDQELSNKRDFDKDHRLQDEVWPSEMPWTRSERSSYPIYNFRSREFEYARPSWLNSDRFWKNADWAPGTKHSSDRPLNAQDLSGKWQSDVPWYAGMWPGGRPRPPFQY